MEEKIDKTRNKLIKKACRTLTQQGAEVIEVYINLFNNLVTIHFRYNGKLLKILDEHVGDNINQTLLRILKN